jgi:hypothetical protein
MGLRLRLALSLFATLLALSLVHSTTSAIQATEPPENSSITFHVEGGLGSYYKNNAWIPLHITLENRGPDLEAQVEIPIRRQEISASMFTHTLYTHAVSLPAGSRNSFFLYVFPETFFDFRHFELRLRDQLSRQVVAEASLRLDPLENYDRLYGLITTQTAPFNRLVELAPPEARAYLTSLSLADLPDQTLGLAALDVLLISDVDTSALRIEQRSALAGWLNSGGLLIVAGGAGWQRTAAGLAEFLPLAPQDTRQLPDLASLTGFIAAPGSKLAPPLPEGPSVVASGPLQPGGETLLSQAGLPLILKKNFGSGQVVYLAPDPAASPLAEWPGLLDFFSAILSRHPELPPWSQGFTNWYSASLVAILQPGLRLPSVFLVCGLLGLYTLALGPLNFLVLRRLGRRELAWASIPVLVLVFSGLAYLTGARLRGSQPLLSRLALVQTWPGQPQARLDGLLGIFSPYRTSYRLELAPRLLAHPLPADTPNSGPSWTLSHTGDQVLLDDLRLEVGGSRTLAVSGWVPAPEFEQDLALRVDAAGATLRGTVTNRSPFALTDLALLAPDRARQMGNLAPGETKQILAVFTSSPATHVTDTPQVMPPGMSVPQLAADGLLQDDLVGTSDFYQNFETRRRYELVNVLVDLSRADSSLTGGFYLSGWSDSASPLEARLADRQTKANDLTLYILALEPVIDAASGPRLLPPALFRWTLLEPGPTDRPTPYQTWLHSGSYSLEYRPALPISYSLVKNLILHLRSYGSSGPCPLEVLLWDFSSGSWQVLAQPVWGDNPVPDASRFTGPGGLLRLRLSNHNPGSVAIEAAEFSLVVE